MTANPVIKTPYLITSRSFPQKPDELEPTLNKMYIDVASAVNARQIGIFDKFQVVTGQRFFNDTNPQQKRQSYRQVYTVTSIINGTTTIPIGFTLDANSSFVHIYGVANNTNTRSVPLPHVNVATPGDGIELGVNWSTSNIEIKTTTANWTAYSAIVVLEYLLN